MIIIEWALGQCMPVLTAQKRKIGKGWGTMDFEGYENLTLRNQELIESCPDNSVACPLERVIFLEEI